LRQRPSPSQPKAFEVIASMLPGGVGYEPGTDEKGQRMIWLERATLNRLAAMRGPGDSCSDVILRLVANEQE
jgi:hypothetical protein